MSPTHPFAFCCVVLQNFVVDHRSISGFMQQVSQGIAEQNMLLRQNEATLLQVVRQAQEDSTKNSLKIQELQDTVNALRQELSNAHGAHLATDSSEETDSEDTPSEPARKKQKVGPDLGPAPAMTFPTKLKGLKFPGLFVDFCTNGWYELMRDGAQAPAEEDVKRTVRAAMASLSLLLEDHVPPLPEGARAGGIDVRALEWRKGVRKQGLGAWEKAQESLKTHLEACKKKKTASISTFEKIMKTTDPDSWPDGPTGEDAFSFLRDKPQLADGIIKSKAQKEAAAAAAAAAPDNISNSD